MSDSVLKQRCLSWLPLAAFALLLIVGVVHHEPWRDEADSWLAARDGTASSMPPYLRNGGTPGLWYLVLLPPAKAGLPYATQAWINALITIAAAFVFLRHAPFPLWLRCLILLSYYPAYEYSIIARSYGLSVLLIFIAAASWRNRYQHPLGLGLVLALLANTNIQSLLIAALLALWFFIELAAARLFRERHVAALAIAATGMLLAIAQVVPNAGGVQPGPVSRGILENFVAVWQNAIAPARRLIAPSLAPVCMILNVAAVLATIVALVRKPRLLAFYLIAVAALTALFTIVYFGGIRHAGFVFLVTILAWWLFLDDPPALPPPLAQRIALPVLAFALLVSCVASAMTYRLDIRHAFSGSKDMAEFIRRNGFSDRTIAAFPDPIAASVVPYLQQRQIWYAGRQEFGSNMKWDAAQYENRRIPLELALQRIDARFHGDPQTLILVASPIDQPEARGYRLLHQTGIWVFSAADERYCLYERVAPGSP